ncbi:glycine-rich RNA-binding protein RZ1B isoform X1 [Capsicum chacoense]
MLGEVQGYRIFVGGLSWDVTERQLEDAFSPFGKILDCQVMLERDTGRPRGFGFLTFADRRTMEDAIREMDGTEVGDRLISVNKAQPKIGSENPEHGYGGGYLSGGRASYGGDNRSVRQDTCFSCGRPGHWARECPLEGGGRGAQPPTPPPRSRHGDACGNVSGSDRDRYVDDRYDRGNYAHRERYDNRYGICDRYTSNRYPPSGDCLGNRHGGFDQYPQNGYGKEREFGRDVSMRDVADRYEAGGPACYEGRSYRDRAGPYDRPRRGRRPPSFDRY